MHSGARFARCRTFSAGERAGAGRRGSHVRWTFVFQLPGIPLLTQHYPMLQRNLLYTGVTRGKRLVVLIGQKKAIAIAVRNISGRRRWSKLRDWLTSKPTANAIHGAIEW
jgi:hypothetical protein